MTRSPELLLLTLCFLLSGFAALVYQTAWTRQFAFVFGTSELAVAASVRELASKREVRASQLREARRIPTTLPPSGDVMLRRNIQALLARRLAEGAQ